MKLSFCIPSLNRLDYLIHAVNSICKYKDLSHQFEICIYNNNSDVSYLELEELLFRYASTYQINYLKGEIRLPVDRSMQTVTAMAKGEYLFLLGDDDFLLENGVENIIKLIDKSEFDLAVYNATILHERNQTKSQMFNIKSGVYNNLDEALILLKNYCSYGNILIKRKFLSKENFDYLNGTFHAYGGFWIDFFKQYENDQHPIIIVPEQKVVCLRAILKTYDLLKVTFNSAKYELELYYKIIGPKSKELLMRYEAIFWKEQSRFFKLLQYGLAGNNLILIKDYNRDFYLKNYKTIFLAIFFTKILFPIKGVIKRVKQIFTRNRC